MVLGGAVISENEKELSEERSGLAIPCDGRAKRDRGKIKLCLHSTAAPEIF